jgi:hypothetical protein
MTAPVVVGFHAQGANNGTEARVEVRQQHLDMREELLIRLQTAINNLDRESQKTPAEAKELYASAEA